MAKRNFKVMVDGISVTTTTLTKRQAITIGNKKMQEYPNQVVEIADQFNDFLEFWWSAE
jgi:hypothetical protein